MSNGIAAVPGASRVSTRSFLIGLGVTVASLVILLVIDVLLARVERRETAFYAASLYAEGNARLEAGATDDAIDRLSSAVALERDSSAYAVALAGGLLARKRPHDAEALLKPLLERNATNGAANLAMARVLRDERRFNDAKSFYHRAIYGNWSVDPIASRNEVRFELIDLLAQLKNSQELLAELLPLEDARPTDIAFRTRLGGLFVMAGSPIHATRVLRDVIRQSPASAEAHIGLAESEMELGHLRSALAYVKRAAEIAHSDRRTDSLRVLLDTAIALNPDESRASEAERYRRSVELLRRSVAFLRSCTGPSLGGPIFSAADSMMAPSGKRVPPTILERDANVAMAQSVWRQRGSTCRGTTGFEGQLLQLVHGAVLRQ